jgi:hypothetical protein
MCLKHDHKFKHFFVYGGGVVVVVVVCFSDPGVVVTFVSVSECRIK